MSKFVMMFAPPDLFRKICFYGVDKLDVVSHLDEYSVSKNIETEYTGIYVADEAFDLTNNPSRQEEREEKYGNGRSLSVGDIVKTGNEMYLCTSFGWKLVNV